MHPKSPPTPSWCNLQPTCWSPDPDIEKLIPGNISMTDEVIFEMKMKGSQISKDCLSIRIGQLPPA